MRRLALIGIVALGCGTRPTAIDAKTQTKGLDIAVPSTPRLVFDEEHVFRGGEEVNYVRYLADDADAYVLGAFDLPNGQPDVAIVESGSGQDADASDLARFAHVIAQSRPTLSIEQRLAWLQDAYLAGDIEEGVYIDVGSRLRDRDTGKPRPKVSAAGEALLGQADPSTRLPTIVCGSPPPPPKYPEHEIANEILLNLDRETAKATLASLQAAHEAAVNAVAADLQASLPQEARAQVLEGRPCIAAQLLPPEVTTLVDSVDHIYVGDEAKDWPTAGAANGQDVRLGTQTEAFRTNNEIGGHAPSNPNESFARLTAAVADVGINEQHDAFKDNSSATRVVKQYECNSTTCTVVSNITPGAGSHGTEVMGSLGADLFDAQDPNYTSTTDRDYRTGIAGEVGLLPMEVSGSLGSATATVRADANHVDSLNSSRFPTNIDTCADATDTSASFTINTQCMGDYSGNGGVWETDVYNAVDDGVFFVQAAGNENARTTDCECTLVEPADADGAFVVGALLESGDPCNDTNKQAQVRSATIASFSSEGGGELAGFPSVFRERTIVGLAAPGKLALIPSCTSGTNCNTANLSQYGCHQGTSFAAPTVASAAMAFKDSWLSEGHSPSTWLDDARNMYAYMLLMGDRVSNDGSTLLTLGYSTLYGAGRMKMRRFTEAGMDAPWLEKSGSATISDGQQIQMWVSSDGTEQHIPSASDALKIVLWWHEPDTETGVTAYITLQTEVFTDFGGFCNAQLSGSTTTDGSADTHKRIYLNGIGGHCIRINITGVDMPTGTRQVHWAFYYEDTARDDTDGPTLHSPVQGGDVELP